MECDNFVLKKWLLGVGAMRRKKFLKKLKNGLESHGLNKQQVYRGLLQLVTRSRVLLTRSTVADNPHPRRLRKNEDIGKCEKSSIKKIIHEETVEVHDDEKSSVDKSTTKTVITETNAKIIKTEKTTIPSIVETNIPELLDEKVGSFVSPIFGINNPRSSIALRLNSHANATITSNESTTQQSRKLPEIRIADSSIPDDDETNRSPTIITAKNSNDDSSENPKISKKPKIIDDLTTVDGALFHKLKSVEKSEIRTKKFETNVSMNNDKIAKNFKISQLTNSTQTIVEQTEISDVKNLKITKNNRLKRKLRKLFGKTLTMSDSEEENGIVNQTLPRKRRRMETRLSLDSGVCLSEMGYERVTTTPDLGSTEKSSEIMKNEFSINDETRLFVNEDKNFRERNYHRSMPLLDATETPEKMVNDDSTLLENLPDSSTNFDEKTIAITNDRCDGKMKILITPIDALSADAFDPVTLEISIANESRVTDGSRVSTATSTTEFIDDTVRSVDNFTKDDKYDELAKLLEINLKEDCRITLRGNTIRIHENDADETRTSDETSSTMKNIEESLRIIENGEIIDENRELPAVGQTFDSERSNKSIIIDNDDSKLKFDHSKVLTSSSAKILGNNVTTIDRDRSFEKIMLRDEKICNDDGNLDFKMSNQRNLSEITKNCDNKDDRVEAVNAEGKQTNENVEKTKSQTKSLIDEIIEDAIFSTAIENSRPSSRIVDSTVAMTQSVIKTAPPKNREIQSFDKAIENKSMTKWSESLEQPMSPILGWPVKKELKPDIETLKDSVEQPASPILGSPSKMQKKSKNEPSNEFAEPSTSPILGTPTKINNKPKMEPSDEFSERSASPILETPKKMQNKCTVEFSERPTENFAAPILDSPSKIQNNNKNNDNTTSKPIPKVRLLHHSELGSRWCPTPLNEHFSTTNNPNKTAQTFVPMQFVFANNSYDRIDGNLENFQSTNQSMNLRCSPINSGSTTMTINNNANYAMENSIVTNSQATRGPPDYFAPRDPSIVRTIPTATNRRTDIADPPSYNASIAHNFVPPSTPLMTKMFRYFIAMHSCIERCQFALPGYDFTPLKRDFQKNRSLLWCDLRDYCLATGTRDLDFLTRYIVDYYDKFLRPEERVLNHSRVMYLLSLRDLPPSNNPEIGQWIQNSQTNSNGIYRNPNFHNSTNFCPSQTTSNASTSSLTSTTRLERPLTTSKAKKSSTRGKKKRSLLNSDQLRIFHEQVLVYNLIDKISRDQLATLQRNRVVEERQHAVCERPIGATLQDELKRRMTNRDNEVVDGTSRNFDNASNENSAGQRLELRGCDFDSGQREILDNRRQIVRTVTTTATFVPTLNTSQLDTRRISGVLMGEDGPRGSVATGRKSWVGNNENVGNTLNDARRSMVDTVLNLALRDSVINENYDRNTRQMDITDSSGQLPTIDQQSIDREIGYQKILPNCVIDQRIFAKNVIVDATQSHVQQSSGMTILTEYSTPVDTNDYEKLDNNVAPSIDEHVELGPYCEKVIHENIDKTNDKTNVVEKIVDNRCNVRVIDVLNEFDNFSTESIMKHPEKNVLEINVLEKNVLEKNASSMQNLDSNENSAIRNENSSMTNENSSMANENSSMTNENSSMTNENSSMPNENSSMTNEKVSVIDSTATNRADKTIIDETKNCRSNDVDDDDESTKSEWSQAPLVIIDDNDDNSDDDYDYIDIIEIDDCKVSPDNSSIISDSNISKIDNHNDATKFHESSEQKHIETIDPIVDNDETDMFNILEVKSISKDVFNSMSENGTTSMQSLSPDNREIIDINDSVDENEILPNCFNCEKPSFVACEQCCQAFYCSVDCHRSHWDQIHHKICKPSV